MKMAGSAFAVSLRIWFGFVSRVSLCTRVLVKRLLKETQPPCVTRVCISFCLSSASFLYGRLHRWRWRCTRENIRSVCEACTSHGEAWNSLWNVRLENPREIYHVESRRRAPDCTFDKSTRKIGEKSAWNETAAEDFRRLFASS